MIQNRLELLPTPNCLFSQTEKNNSIVINSLLNENIIIIFEKNMKTHHVSIQMGKYKCENLVSLLTILMGYFHSRTLLKICLPDKI